MTLSSEGKEKSDVAKEEDGLAEIVIEKWLLKFDTIPELMSNVHTQKDLKKWIKKYPALTLTIVQAFLEISFGVVLT